jgi:hypothetical protein
MIRKLVSMLADRFKHPVLMGLYVIAAVLLVGSVATQFAGRPLLAGFLGVYAVLFAAVGTIGYAVLFLGQLVTTLEQQYGPT